MNQTLNLSDFYCTSDLALATALSLYFPIEAVDRQNPNKAQFLFKRDENLSQLVEAFWKKELSVEPQAYFQQLRIIKARLHEEG